MEIDMNVKKKEVVINLSLFEESDVRMELIERVVTCSSFMEI